MVDLATFGSQLAQGIARNTSPEQQLARAEARTLQAEQAAKLRKIQLQNTPEMQQLQVDSEREELELLRAQNQQNKRVLLKNRVMDSLKEFDTAQNPDVLNRMLVDMRNDGMNTGPLLEGIVRFDPVGEGDRQAFTDSGYDADDILTSPEARNSLVRVTLDDGSTEIRNLDDLKAFVGYQQYASEQERERMKGRLELEVLRKQLASPDAIAVNRAASDNRIRELQAEARLKRENTRQERDLAIIMLANHGDLQEGSREWAQAYEQERKAYETAISERKIAENQAKEGAKGDRQVRVSDSKAANKLREISARAKETRLTNSDKISAQKVADSELLALSSSFDRLLQSERLELAAEDEKELAQLQALLDRQSASLKIEDQTAADKDKAEFQAKLTAALQKASDGRKAELAKELIQIQSAYDAANTAQEIALRADAEIKVSDFEGKLERLAKSEEITQRSEAAESLATLQASLNRVTNSLSNGERAEAQQEAIRLQGSIQNLLQSERLSATSKAAKELAELNSQLGIIATSAQINQQSAANQALAETRSELRQGETAARIDQQSAADQALAGVQSELRQGETAARIGLQSEADQALAGVQSELRQGETAARIDQQSTADQVLAGVQSELRQGETAARIDQQSTANQALAETQSELRQGETAARINQQSAANQALAETRSGLRQDETTARINQQRDANITVNAARPQPEQRRTQQDIDVRNIMLSRPQFAQLQEGTPEWAQAYEQVRQEYIAGNFAARASANVKRTAQDTTLDNYMLLNHPDLSPESAEYAQLRARRQAELDYQKNLPKNAVQAQVNDYMEANFSDLPIGSPEYVTESLKYRQQLLREKQENLASRSRTAGQKENDQRIETINNLRNRVTQNFGGRRFVDIPREELDEDPTIETDIESIERLGKLALSNDDKEVLAEVSELMEFAGTAVNLTDQQTGLIDSTIGGLSRYFSDDITGIQETAAYASFRNMFQRAISGLTVTKGEDEKFQKQVPQLTQQRGPVLAAMKVAVQGLKNRIDTIAGLNNSLVSHYRLGVTKQDIRKTVRGLDSLLNTIDKTERRLDLNEQAQEVNQASEGAFTLSPDRMAAMQAIFSGSPAPSAEVTGETRTPTTPASATPPASATLTPERLQQMQAIFNGVNPNEN